MNKTNWSVIYEKDWITQENYIFTYSEEEKQENEINRENAKKYCKYLVIQMKVFSEYKLSWNEAIIFSFIDSWIWDWKKFYFTNIQLANLFNISIDSITRITKILSKKWLISLWYKRKANWWQIRFINIKSPLLKIRSSNSLKYGVANPQNTEEVIYNISKNNIINNNNSNFSSKTKLVKKWNDKNLNYEEKIEKLREINNKLDKEENVLSWKRSRWIPDKRMGVWIKWLIKRWYNMKIDEQWLIDLIERFSITMKKYIGSSPITWELPYNEMDLIIDKLFARIDDKWEEVKSRKNKILTFLKNNYK
jgi:hypothetical protein